MNFMRTTTTFSSHEGYKPSGVFLSSYFKKLTKHIPLLQILFSPFFTFTDSSKPPLAFHPSLQEEGKIKPPSSVLANLIYSTII